ESSDQSPYGLVAGIDDEMRRFAIERIAGAMQLFQARQRIRGSEQGPVAIVPGAQPQLRGRSAKVHHRPGGMQQSPVLRIEHHATPGCQHEIRQLDQLADDSGLALPEAGLAFDFEYHRNSDTGTALDLVVRI